MACDLSVASDMALFGQAGPKHGSAPDGGATDFLPLYVGVENAMFSNTICELWSAHKAKRLGLLSEVAPVLKKDGAYIPNPLVVTDRWVDESGNIVYGEMKTGQAREQAKQLVSHCQYDLSRLDEVVNRYCTALMMTVPDCLTKTVESLRKHKLQHWDRNRETNRAWLSLNMMTEGKAGFKAFNEGARGQREPDFIKMRRMLAEGHRWSDEFIEAIMPSRKA